MHMTKECFNVYNIAFSVPINSKYKPPFDSKVMQIIEAGLVKKYFQIEMDKAAEKAKATLSRTDAEPLTLNHLQAPLYLLPMLLAVGLLVFFLELIFGNPLSKQPNV